MSFPFLALGGSSFEEFGWLVVVCAGGSLCFVGWV
jgi:hypothetical protein